MSYFSYRINGPLRSANGTRLSISTVSFDRKLGETVFFGFCINILSLFIVTQGVNMTKWGSHVIFIVPSFGFPWLILSLFKLVSIWCHVRSSRDLNLVILQKSLCSNMAVTLNITYLLIPINFKLHNGQPPFKSKKSENFSTYIQDSTNHGRFNGPVFCKLCFKLWWRLLKFPYVPVRRFHSKLSSSLSLQVVVYNLILSRIFEFFGVIFFLFYWPLNEDKLNNTRASLLYAGEKWSQ